MRRLISSLSAILLLSCGGDDGGQGSGESGVVSFSATDGESLDASNSQGSGPKLDSLMKETEGAGDEGANNAGCEKVDFLFVIDSSNSMATNQAELIASFPEFVAGIQSTLDDVDSYHVGVVTSDAYQFNEAGCTMFGAVVTQTGGKDSGMETCPPNVDGNRYMTEADDLPVAFQCAALIGTAGANDEMMMLGATEAISPALNAAGACNDGFIRDDALLVLVLITDEDDPGTCVGGGSDCMGSPGDPASWRDDILAVKQFPENVVTLSLTRGAPNNVCGAPQGTELDGTRIMEFVQMWGQTGLLGDICASSFGPFFDEAVGLIDSACEEFVDPVG